MFCDSSIILGIDAIIVGTLIWLLLIQPWISQGWQAAWIYLSLIGIFAVIYLISVGVTWIFNKGPMVESYRSWREKWCAKVEFVDHTQPIESPSDFQSK